LFSPVVPFSCFFYSGAGFLLLMLIDGCSTMIKNSKQQPTPGNQVPVYQLDFTTPGNLP
jgi:hypothetical protein